MVDGPEGRGGGSFEPLIEPAQLGLQQCSATERLPTAPERKRTTTWSAFTRTHLALLAGTDLFTAEVLTPRELMTYYVLFFIHLESRRVEIAGITIHPNEPWMKQMARNVTMEGCGILRDCRYLLHDHDTKFTQSFRAIIASGQVEPGRI
jgi:putative transposase